jgi:thiamine-monophosphate kinase
MPHHKQSENALLQKIRRAFPEGASARRGDLARLRRNSLHLAIGDDAALFRPTPGHESVLTCDWFLEGTHFLRDKHPADSVGWKSLARAISDIAAMGGTPRCFLLSLALPQDATGTWLDAFLAGLRRASKRFDCVLAGGDTTRRDEILISVTVIGEIAISRALRRDGAKPGDLIYVSGRLGEAEQGLRILRKQRGAARRSDSRLRKHLYPEPRLALGSWLSANHLSNAAMDLSDGLSSDLPRLCDASGVGALLYATKLPIALDAGKDGVDLALHGGDDYELLFTIPRSSEKRIPASFQGVPLTQIGEITNTRKLVLIDLQGRRKTLRPQGWDSFVPAAFCLPR